MSARVRVCLPYYTTMLVFCQVFLSFCEFVGLFSRRNGGFLSEPAIFGVFLMLQNEGSVAF